MFCVEDFVYQYNIWHHHGFSCRCFDREFDRKSDSESNIKVRYSNIKGNFSTYSFLLASYTDEILPPAIVTGLWLMSRLTNAYLNVTSNAVAPHVSVSHLAFIAHD